MIQPGVGQEVQQGNCCYLCEEDSEWSCVGKETEVPSCEEHVMDLPPCLAEPLPDNSSWLYIACDSRWRK